MDENDKCSVLQSSDIGNGLAATQDIPAGSLILQIRSPFILVLETPKIERFCSHCFLPLQDGTRKRCTACKVVRYCSTECQRSDWKLIHQKECPVLKEVLPPTPVRALIQVLLLHISGSAHDNNRWQALEAHVEEFKADKQGWEDIRLQAMFAAKYSKTPPAQSELAIQILCRVCCWFHYQTLTIMLLRSFQTFTYFMYCNIALLTLL
jgi:SET and MYND domain-containing protein